MTVPASGMVGWEHAVWDRLDQTPTTPLGVHRGGNAADRARRRGAGIVRGGSGRC